MNLSLQDIADLELRLPPFFRRADVEELTDEMFKSSYLAVLHSRGAGPRCARLSRNIVYKRDDFIKWVKEQYYGRLFKNSNTGD